MVNDFFFFCINNVDLYIHTATKIYTRFEEKKQSF